LCIIAFSLSHDSGVDGASGIAIASLDGLSDPTVDSCASRAAFTSCSSRIGCVAGQT
jgi:hypothetical protein